MNDDAPQASANPDARVGSDHARDRTNHYTIGVHMADVGVRIEADEVKDGTRSYARLHVADVVFFVRDAEQLQKVARAAMASALRLERLLEAANATGDVGVTDADVDAALAGASADA